MKIIKIKKSLLKQQWDEILTAVEAVDAKTNQAFPGSVYMSKADIKTVRDNHIKQLKKYNKGTSSFHIKKAESYLFLNLGANEYLQDAIISGYVLVDDEQIQRELNELNRM
jgi:hypothetical protein